MTFYGTYALASNPTEEHTITCEVQLGHGLTAEVKEYDKNFSFNKGTATKRLSAANAGALSDTDGYHRNYDPELYALAVTQGGQSRQSCAAITEIPPEDADTIVGTKYIVKKFGAVYYDSKDAQKSNIGVETTKQYDYTMPKPEGKFSDLMKPIETTVKDRQLLAEQTHTAKASVLKA